MSRPPFAKFIASLAFLPWVGLWALEVPFLSGRVNDLAELLPDAEEQRLSARLAQLERATGAQVVVLTIPSLEGENLEEFSHRVASTWQLGQKGQDNGVLFLIAKNDRKMRLEVGYGLEAKLTDVTARRILDNVVRPRFRNGDFPGGIEAGVETLAKVLETGQLPEEKPVPSGGSGEVPGVGFTLLFLGVFLLVVGTFSFMAIFSTGCQSWLLYLFLLPIWIVFPVILHPVAGLAAGLGWLLLFPILKGLLHHTRWGKEFQRSHSTLFTSGGGGRSFSGFSFGSFSGRGGFSGGGGSFGGGGASSSW
ncbi:MAG: TPM domain-containing protein [Thermoanaerobaculaceae bacterium]